MASDPYCAVAPSRRICRFLIPIDGIDEMSDPCEPNARPLSPPAKVWTSAERLKRLPLSITSTSSGGRPRSEGGRTKVDASEIVFCPTKNEGTMFFSVSSMLAVGDACRSSDETTSTGEAESVTLRSSRRVPVTTISRDSSAALVGSSPAGVGGFWVVWAHAGIATAKAAALTIKLRTAFAWIDIRDPLAGFDERALGFDERTLSLTALANRG